MNLTQIKVYFENSRQQAYHWGFRDFSANRDRFASDMKVSNSTAAYWLEKAVKAGILKKALSRPANCYAHWIYTLADCPVDPNDVHKRLEAEQLHKVAPKPH